MYIYTKRIRWNDKKIAKLSVDNVFEYTDNENDVCYFDSIKNIIRHNLDGHRKGIMDNKLEKHILGLFNEENKMIKCGEFIKKLNLDEKLYYIIIKR